jgi:hypothetical protein
LFYTVHSEIGPGNPKTPDFIPIGYGVKDVTYHNVITEWHAMNPAANTFAGTRRETIRAAHVVANLKHVHEFGDHSLFSFRSDAVLLRCLMRDELSSQTARG